MSELGQTQAAAGKVFDDFWEAYERGEISSPLMIGIQLMITAICLKKKYRDGGLAVVREYFQTWEFDYYLAYEQVEARIYEYIQLDRMERNM